jgi:hypothetical protein
MRRRLLQSRVLHFRSNENGNVRVGVSPEPEKILVCRLGLGDFALHGIGTGKAKMGECTQRVTIHRTTMVHVFLEFGTCLASLPQQQIRLAPLVGRLKRSPQMPVKRAGYPVRRGPQPISDINSLIETGTKVRASQQ